MTALGKILVFVNLVFSLLTMALIGMVFFTRTNWKAAYDKQTANLQVAQSVANQDAERLTKAQKDTEAIVKQREREIAERDKKIAAAEKTVADLRTQLSETNKTKDTETEQVKTVTAELERRRAEVKQLGDLKTAADARIVDLEKQLTKTRDDFIEKKLGYDQLKERFQSLLAQYESANKELAQLKARGISAPATTKVPPPENARGYITKIDGNLATISIGTDAGVNKDNVLQIYRLKPNPEYLGTITILNATPFEAVGRLTPAGARVKIQVNDEVAGKIVGQ